VPTVAVSDAKLLSDDLHTGFALFVGFFFFLKKHDRVPTIQQWRTQTTVIGGADKYNLKKKIE
jgi:hypothetical protein